MHILPAAIQPAPNALLFQLTVPQGLLLGSIQVGWSFWALVAGALVLVMIMLAAVAAIYSRKQKLKRDLFRALAPGLGLEYCEEREDDDEGSEGRGGRSSILSLPWNEFLLFRAGGTRDAELDLLLRGRAGIHDVAVFAYSFTVRYGRFVEDYRMTVFAVQASRGILPSFRLTPERFWRGSEVDDWDGNPGLDFEAVPEFSRQYDLKGVPESSVRALFRREVLDFLLAHPRWSAEGFNNRLLLYKGSAFLQPEQFPAA
jgi:hypothetical protein